MSWAPLAGYMYMQIRSPMILHISLAQVPHTHLLQAKPATPKSMADLVMGAMPSLLPKLLQLLEKEYGLQADVKDRVRSLTAELQHSQAALRKVSQVPWDQLDEQVKLWAREVRESSYDMEDVLDTFLVHVQGPDSAEKKGSLKRLREKMANLFNKSKARREVSIGVKNIMSHLDEVMERCRRYKVDDIVAKPASTSMVDLRLDAMYNKVKNLVGIDKSSGELISRLQIQQRGDATNAKMKIVSVVGVGGLGKTTLAKAVYDKHKGDFDCGAFVPVGRNPDLKKVIKAILIGLDKDRYMQFNFAQLDETHQFIDELRDFLLENKRYFIVVDDIWEVESWEKIKLAIDDDNNCGGRIIITTRKHGVATKAGDVYELQTLSDESSRVLFYTRISGDQDSHNNQPDEILDKILKKCGGIPLAIITMASLLVGKPRDKWSEICKTVGFGLKDSKEAENTTAKILSFSYYDLASHLRTCLLYLSAFPEDSFIRKDSLIWMWVAEGFVPMKEGTWIYETGEGYFNDLINRSMIQAVEGDGGDYYVDNHVDGTIMGCRVHDIVLDFIRTMSYEENFFTILDNDQDIPLQSQARRLAYLNGTMKHTHRANHSDVMRTVRSFRAQVCAIDLWTPLSRFTLLRVLAIEGCNLTDGGAISIEEIKHLHHLRYLSLSGTNIDRVPEEIGDLRFLQTLELLGSEIVESPSRNRFPTQLACLRIAFDAEGTADPGVGWVKRLTSLEELLIIDRRFQWKELVSLRELRVLTIFARMDESQRDFAESVSHVDKLQHLTVVGGDDHVVTWEAAGLVLPRQLRHFTVLDIIFLRMPPCISPSCLPNLCHLNLSLIEVDEQDLKNLGGLPELRFLRLETSSSSAVIINVSDNDAVYFPKLRCFKLPMSMVLLVANKEDKSVSFHLWNGDQTDDDELLGSIAPAASNDDNKEDPVVGKGAAAAPCRFMPSLQELHLRVGGMGIEDPRYCDYLGWEYLSSLRRINVDLYVNSSYGIHSAAEVVVGEKLRRAADAHPNRPALSIW